MDLQELITRGRFIFAKASERLRLFELVNGRRNTADLARMTRRHTNNVHRDLQVLLNSGLIQAKTGRDSAPVRVDRFPVYEKVPLARTVPTAYFRGPSRLFASSAPKSRRTSPANSNRRHKMSALPVPSETELLDICRAGEDQLYEFKGQGTDARKITKEIAAMLHTRQGGFIFYGVDDDGTIQGSDVTRQKLDQPVQNSVKNTISPAATVKLHSVKALGHEVVIIAVPPWNRKDVYQYEERIFIRKGTNVFAAKPEEIRKLHHGEYVV
jgi:predicted HTH transcriptional regulator